MSLTVKNIVYTIFTVNDIFIGGKLPFVDYRLMSLIEVTLALTPTLVMLVTKTIVSFCDVIDYARILNFFGSDVKFYSFSCQQV